MESVRTFAIGIALSITVPVGACESLHFNNAWVREPPPVSAVAAGYVTISNPTGDNMVVTDVSSICCRHLMFHESKMDAGQVRMNHLEHLTVPANSQVRLEPLGKHLMLMGVGQKLVAEDSVEITFSCGAHDQTRVLFTINKQN
ncbi:MAG: copper chaperone PCu(A)C [Gammaproteobacteria bacterium]